MRAGMALGLLLGLFAGIVAKAQADPSVTETTTYYLVDGSTIEDIRDDMTANGPQSY